ncbi:Lysine methyltransferase [Trypanosoma melophagium]|uniref:Lysine methyltransferase n=1 Tax=Trypanosoma melophagium TaxID=715481 RepID=UPI00351A456A|nr:Lysine methyltransferase [Trypanosoma melophagium]
MNYETFEVLASADGTSFLKIELACATVKDHYFLCTKSQTKLPNENILKCSTGLRVYEGAQVLAAFFVKFGRMLLPQQSIEESSEASKNWVVELGCGCGLVGFTIATIFPQLCVAFTDASHDCLGLIEATAKRLGFSFFRSECDEFMESTHNTMDRTLLTFPLEWYKEGTDQLLSLLRRFCGRKERLLNGDIRAILGSDLLYYRVDIENLLGTCKSLLQASIEENEGENISSRCFPSMVILTHFVRIPDGARKLQTVAYKLGFGIVRVPTEEFIAEEIIRNRGWNGVSVVVLFLRESQKGYDPEVLTSDEYRRQLEEEDLAKARKLFCEGKFSFPREAFACYSKDMELLDSLMTQFPLVECELSTLPYLVS